MSIPWRRAVRPTLGIMSASIAARVTVTPSPGQEQARATKEHWANQDGTLFRNPWPSFRQNTLGDVAKMIWGSSSGSSNVAEEAKNVPIMTPTFGSGLPSHQIKATWLGHACFLVELPSSSPSTRGVRILFDPVFSHRCSPSSLVGPARFTPAPCKVEDLPEVDAVVISHNHYDHLDIPTLEHLISHSSSPPHLFLPLNTLYCIPRSLRPKLQISELDWWESAQINVDGVGSVRLSCLPAQHFTGRGLFDRMQSLWASWGVEGLITDGGEGKVGAKVWFGGDTGFCAVKDGQHGMDETLPVCPAFKEIGNKFGGFDLGLIPIGAYDPRGFMSPIHCGPLDSVRVFLDTKCKKALGMHWGLTTAHVLLATTEPVDEPPKRLAEARTELKVPDDAFGVCAIGETRAFDVGA